MIAELFAFGLLALLWGVIILGGIDAAGQPKSASRGIVTKKERDDYFSSLKRVTDLERELEALRERYGLLADAVADLVVDVEAGRLPQWSLHHVVAVYKKQHEQT
jgi:hypothetical protein